MYTRLQRLPKLGLAQQSLNRRLPCLYDAQLIMKGGLVGSQSGRLALAQAIPGASRTTEAACKTSCPPFDTPQYILDGIDESTLLSNPIDYPVKAAFETPES